MVHESEVIPVRGERAIIAGQTGSGKTTLACWLVQRLPRYPRYILDLKVEPKFARLEDALVTSKHKDAIVALHKRNPPKHVVYRPPADVVQSPESLDALLQEHYTTGKDMPIYIDEAYMVHIAGRAGPGLISLLTRGRSRGITTILSTQRPVWVSRFCWSEAQHFYIMRLSDAKDRAKVADVVPLSQDIILPKHHWAHWTHDQDEPVHYLPVPMEGKGGYVDEEEDDVGRWV